MNPMLTNLNQSKFSSLQNALRTVRMAANPQLALQQMAQQNPEMQQAMQIVQQNGGDARAAFYQLAKQKGIDPNSILNSLR